MFEKAAAQNNLDIRGAWNLARAYYWAPGNRARAREKFGRAIQLAEERLNVNPRDPEAQITLAHCYAMLDLKVEAFDHLKRALSLRPNDSEFQYFAALVHNHFGERTTALAWLEKAVAGGYSAAEIQTSIEVDNLRDDPKFQKLVQSK